MGLLRHPFDAVLSSTTKVRLIRALLPISRPVSLREAARLARISSPSVALNAMEDLVAMAIVRRAEGTAQHLFTINHDHALTGALADLFAAEEARWKRLQETLRAALLAGTSPGAVEAAAIFGSAARGDDRPDSDLDLLVVTRDQEESGAVFEALLELQPELEREFGVRLSSVVMALERLRERAKAGDPFVELVADESIPLIKPSLRTLIDGQTGAS